MIDQNYINNLTNAIIEDYMAFSAEGTTNLEGFLQGQYGTLTEFQCERIEDFIKKVTVTEGKKYIKILCDRSVWGFVVNVDDDKKFKRGDILKPAGFSAPARNKPRGNVIAGGYRVQWTGPNYLR
jgi:hypothetical protein